jgi:hypothetical protein
MNDYPRAPKAVSAAPGKPRVPEPHPADYGNLPDEMFAYIEKNTDQEALSKGEVGKRFEW